MTKKMLSQLFYVCAILLLTSCASIQKPKKNPCASAIYLLLPDADPTEHEEMIIVPLELEIAPPVGWVIKSLASRTSVTITLYGPPTTTDKQVSERLRTAINIVKSPKDSEIAFAEDHCISIDSYGVERDSS